MKAAVITGYGPPDVLAVRGVIVYPLEKIREAHVQQETKHTRGKIVIHLG